LQGTVPDHAARDLKFCHNSPPRGLHEIVNGQRLNDQSVVINRSRCTVEIHYGANLTREQQHVVSQSQWV